MEETRIPVPSSPLPGSSGGTAAPAPMNLPIAPAEMSLEAGPATQSVSAPLPAVPKPSLPAPARPVPPPWTVPRDQQINIPMIPTKPHPPELPAADADVTARGRKASYGALISIIIIIAIVVVGAFYAWGERIAQDHVPAGTETTVQNTGAQ